MNKQTTALQRIYEIEREIINAANLKALLERNLAETTSGEARTILAGQKQDIEKRIVRAQAEIKAIEDAHFAEIQIERRNRKYPPVPAPKKIYIGFVDGLEPLATAAGN